MDCGRSGQRPNESAPESTQVTLPFAPTRSQTATWPTECVQTASMVVFSQRRPRLHIIPGKPLVLDAAVVEVNDIVLRAAVQSLCWNLGTGAVTVAIEKIVTT